MSQDAILSALRLCAGSPGAAETLLQEEHWAQRQALCLAIENALNSGDWFAMLAALNHDRAAERLHWAAALLLDALKVQQGATLLTNPECVPDTGYTGEPGAVSYAVRHCMLCCMLYLLAVSSLLNRVVGLNRELLLTDQLLRIEHYLQPGATPPVSHL